MMGSTLISPSPAICSEWLEEQGKERCPGECPQVRGIISACEQMDGKSAQPPPPEQFLLVWLFLHFYTVLLKVAFATQIFQGAARTNR